MDLLGFRPPKEEMVDRGEENLEEEEDLKEDPKEEEHSKRSDSSESLGSSRDAAELAYL